MTPHFYFINELYYQNVDVCKKLDLKILKFDRLAAVFLRIQNFLTELRKIQFSWISLAGRLCGH